MIWTCHFLSQKIAFFLAVNRQNFDDLRADWKSKSPKPGFCEPQTIGQRILAERITPPRNRPQRNLAQWKLNQRTLD